MTVRGALYDAALLYSAGVHATLGVLRIQPVGGDSLALHLHAMSEYTCLHTFLVVLPQWSLSLACVSYSLQLLACISACGGRPQGTQMHMYRISGVYAFPPGSVSVGHHEEPLESAGLSGDSRQALSGLMSCQRIISIIVII
jgi:hypothetical protein